MLHTLKTDLEDKFSPWQQYLACLLALGVGLLMPYMLEVFDFNVAVVLHNFFFMEDGEVRSCCIVSAFSGFVVLVSVCILLGTEC